MSTQNTTPGSLHLRELIGSAVISRLSGAILGNVADIVIEPYENKVYALLIKTYSIIPLSRIILFHNITDFTKGRVIVKSENSVDSLSSYKFPENAVLYRPEANNKPIYKNTFDTNVPRTPLGILKNARCDAETGYIQEFIFSKQKYNLPWTRNEKIAVNKFRTVDNTIIIE